MKVLHINLSDKTGGAAIAAARHNEAMRKIGIDSKLLVVNAQTKDPGVIQLPGRPLINEIRAATNNFISNYLVKRYVNFGKWSNASLGIHLSSNQDIREADIIILHWINGGMLSIKGVEEILKLGKEVIWFMHDMWPITGGCHYSMECDLFQTQCKKCPFLENTESGSPTKDYAQKQFSEKIKRWSKYSNLSIVTPSKWLANKVAESRLFGKCKVNVFHNILDTSKYKIVDKTAAREILNLPKDKKLLLFGADFVKSTYKGFNNLKKALELLKNEDIEIVVFGNTEETLLVPEIPTHYIGRVSDDISLVVLYNACDVFVTPSIADNFPNVLLEALSCGLPCVGFHVGGIPELISHKVTGYISSEICPEGLRDGINWIFKESDYDRLRKEARKWVEENASYSIVSETNNIITHSRINHESN
jgi:glycosyltransferase involved in cell wall biosynthesis